MSTCAAVGCQTPAYCRGWCRMHYVRWQRHGDPSVNLRRLPPEARFLARIERTASGCWEWTAARNSNNYGLFVAQMGPGTIFAHRWSYEHFVGPIPDGFHIDHLCRNPPCVNPAHLEPVTPAENARRGRNAQREKTHCKHGHPFSMENTYYRLTGGRRCRTCQRETDRKRLAAKRWLEHPIESNSQSPANSPDVGSNAPALPLGETE